MQKPVWRLPNRSTQLWSSAKIIRVSASSCMGAKQHREQAEKQVVPSRGKTVSPTAQWSDSRRCLLLSPNKTPMPACPGHVYGSQQGEAGGLHLCTCGQHSHLLLSMLRVLCRTCSCHDNFMAATCQIKHPHPGHQPCAPAPAPSAEYVECALQHVQPPCQLHCSMPRQHVPIKPCHDIRQAAKHGKAD